jgi:hypothetical protein
LIAFGLGEGSRNRHPGQGTANRRFFFNNAMLELLWVENAHEAQSAGVRRLRLWERWSQRAAGACPFGICYRPVSQRGIPAPFESWQYAPLYAEIGIAVSVTSINVDEPLLFYLPYLRRTPDNEPIAHAAGVRNLSSAIITGPNMQLTFDGGEKGLNDDFRPDFPLIIKR